MRSKLVVVIGAFVALLLSACTADVYKAPVSSDPVGLSIKSVALGSYSSYAYVDSGPKLKAEAVIVGYGLSAEDLGYGAIGLYVDSEQFAAYTKQLDATAGSKTADYDQAVKTSGVNLSKDMMSELTVINNTSLDAVASQLVREDTGKAPATVIVEMLPLPSCKGSVTELKGFAPEMLTPSNPELSVEWCPAPSPSSTG